MSGIDLSHSMASANHAPGTGHFSGGGNGLHDFHASGSGTHHIPNSNFDVHGGGSIMNNGGHVEGGGSVGIIYHPTSNMDLGIGGYGNSFGGGGVFGGITLKL